MFCLQCGGTGLSLAVTASGKAYAAYAFNAAKVDTRQILPLFVSHDIQPLVNVHHTSHPTSQKIMPLDTG